MDDRCGDAIDAETADGQIIAIVNEAADGLARPW